MSESTANAGGETFAELFEATSSTIKEGEVVRGKVLSIDEDNIQIDIGFKSEGLVPTWEFMEEDGTLLVAVGDDVLAHESIGSVGESGSLIGPRLYFEIRRGDEALDPADWLEP